MLKAAAANGWLDERRSVLEALTSIARAGADMTITYYAKDVARWLAGESQVASREVASHEVASRRQ
jgi:porphobilinogen synthase